MHPQVLTTSLKLLNFRGFQVSESDIKLVNTTSSSSFEATWASPNGNTHRAVVISLHIDPVGIEQIRALIDRIHEEHWHLVLLILKSNLKSNLKDLIQQQCRSCVVQIFLEEELYFDVTRHVAVPTHRLLNSHELKSQVLSPFRCTIEQLPKLSADDIICRFYGFKKNDVIEISRPSESVGQCKEYKVVF